MKIVTWNVNSLKAREAYVAGYLDETKPDVVCLQELKQTEEAIAKELFLGRGYELAIHGQLQWNGVLIASRSPIRDVVKGLPDADEGQARLIACQIEDLKLVNLYCPQGHAEDSPKFQYKLRFYSALREWLAANYTAKDNLLIVGDLNIAPLKTDVWDVNAFQNVPSYHPLEHEHWRALLDFGLEDVVAPHIEPGQFTFWDYRGAHFRENRGMRIDHMLGTKSVSAWVQDASIDREARKKTRWKCAVRPCARARHARSQGQVDDPPSIAGASHSGRRKLVDLSSVLCDSRQPHDGRWPAYECNLWIRVDVQQDPGRQAAQVRRDDFRCAGCHVSGGRVS